MVFSESLRRVLLLSLTFVALFGGDGLHGLLHHDELRSGSSTDELHGEDCDDCVEREAVRDEAHCLLCQSTRLGEFDIPTRPIDATTLVEAPHPLAKDFVARPRSARPSAALGARAPPAGA